MNTPYHLLTSTVTVEAPTYARGDDGSQYVSSYASAVSIACTIQPSRNSESQRYMRETGTRVSTLFLAPVDSTGTATALDKNAVVTIGSLKYRVIGGLQDAAGKGVLYTAEVEEIT